MMWQIITPQRDMYADITGCFAKHGARYIEMSPHSSLGGSLNIPGKWQIVLSLINSRLLGLRGMWSDQDNLLVIGWHILPVLALIKIGFLKTPKQIVSLGCFVHSQKIRQVVNRFFRWMRLPGLKFIVFSRYEFDSIVNGAGVPSESVLLHLWRQELNGRVSGEDIQEEGYIFSGGYSNRDYGLLVEVLKRLRIPAVIVASRNNEIPDVTGYEIKVFRDLDEAEFERYLAHSKLVVLPLKQTGEACGQSVLIRVLRNHKPLIVTKHDAVEDYLGANYPGFVDPANEEHLYKSIQKALTDHIFSDELRRQVTLSNADLDSRPSPGDEIYEWVSAQHGYI